MEGDVFHSVEEFHKLPWHELKPDRWSRSWSTCAFGHSHPQAPDACCIAICHPDLHTDYWIVPEALKAIIKGHEEIGREEVRHNFRIAFDKLMDIVKMPL